MVVIDGPVSSTSKSSSACRTVTPKDNTQPSTNTHSPKYLSPDDYSKNFTPPESQASSVRESDTASVLPSYVQAESFKGYSSEGEYLKALRAWVEEKKYFKTERHALVGFYGTKTMDKYMGPSPWQERKEQRARAKSESDVKLGIGRMGDSQEALIDGSASIAEQGQRRRSVMGKILRRRVGSIAE